MQKISKLFAVLCLVLGLGLSQASAQVQLGLNVGAGIPLGDGLGDNLETGFGLNAKFNYFVKENLALGATLGYYSFEWEPDERWNRNVIPLTFNVEYYFKPSKVKPFIGGGLGLYFYSWDRDNDRGFDEDYDDDTELGLHLGGGLLFEVGKNVDLGADLRFNIIEDESFMGIHFGAYFKL
jgi:opacity protein-like surface antigen